MITPKKLRRRLKFLAKWWDPPILDEGLDILEIAINCEGTDPFDILENCVTPCEKGSKFPSQFDRVIAHVDHHMHGEILYNWIKDNLPKK